LEPTEAGTTGLERDEEQIRRWIHEDWLQVKNARRRGAASAFMNESCFLMGPVVRRSCALRGHTPMLRSRGRYRINVSVIGHTELVWDRLNAHRGQPVKAGSSATPIASAPPCCRLMRPSSIRSS